MRNSVLIRKFFYRVTGIVFLREWYIKRKVLTIFPDKNSVKDILDAGSGFGQYCYYCRRKFPEAEILGIDINKNYIDECNQFAGKAGIEGLKFRKQDLTAINYKNRFDLILSVDVLEHIKDDVRLLYLLKIAVKPGGFIIISTPTIYRKHKKDGMFVDEHEREGYAEEDIMRKLKNSGFSNIDITYTYGIFGDLSWRLGIRNFMKLSESGSAGKIFAFLYFIVIFPLVFLLMVMDYYLPNKTGTGFVIVAQG